MNKHIWTMGSPDEVISGVAMTAGVVDPKQAGGDKPPVYPATKKEARSIVSRVNGCSTESGEYSAFKLEIYERREGPEVFKDLLKVNIDGSDSYVSPTALNLLQAELEETVAKIGSKKNVHVAMYPAYKAVESKQLNDLGIPIEWVRAEPQEVLDFMRKDPKTLPESSKKPKGK